ncbi:apses transcription factor [Hortaea werneckii]|nr:apses transcription factor [Hortaea werneckii]
MARNSPSQMIYSATYSNVPVYECNVEGNHVMRRRSDDWINATHILKVADYDKPSRTRILEREVQKGTHEKVQGGYGKYQGTWIPLEDGRDLAAKNGVLEKLMPIFTFVPGDRSPPPAPKHLTAASSKPRVPKAVAAQKRTSAPALPPVANMYHPHQASQDFDVMDTTMHEATPDDDTVASESQFADDYPDMSYHTGGSRKRRRVEDVMSQADREHQLWAEELLDYFVLQDSPMDQPSAPQPPAGVNINRAIDDRGHTALHWAAAMGDIEVVKDLIRLGADIAIQSKSGETPLMRSVIFTNNFDKRCMERLAALLVRTVNMQEWFGSTVFHHIAGITQSKKKYECARYYMDCILNKMTENLTPQQVETVLNVQDQNGDTAITIAARNGARKCVRSLIGRNAAVDIPNHNGETADQLIVQLNHRRQERTRAMSSSPFQADGAPVLGGAVQPPGGSASIDPLLQSTPTGSREVYKSEAALTLTSSLLPDFVNKTRALAQQLEAELAEKEAELAEAERLVQLRKSESDALRKQAEELRVKELEQTSGGSKRDEDLIRELEALERECEGWVVEEEKLALADLLEAERARLPPTPPAPSSTSPPRDPAADEATLHEKLRLSRQLLEATRQRREHIARIVHYLGLADDGEALKRQDQYKRLITGALGVREEDVEGMLPEIVGELEETRVAEVV